MRTIVFAVLISGVDFAAPARANLNVFACEPEWGALVKELGGDKVDIYVATSGKQDPHQIQARPSLIAKARDADMTVCSGSELEVGWLPMVARQSANGKIQPGSPGAFEAASYVHMLEIPARLDRAEGVTAPKALVITTEYAPTSASRALVKVNAEFVAPASGVLVSKYHW